MYNPCNKLNKKNAHKIDEKRKTLIFYSRLPARNKNKTLVYGFFVTYRIHDKKIEANKIFFTTKKLKLSGMIHMDFRLNCYSLIFQNKSGDRLFFF